MTRLLATAHFLLLGSTDSMFQTITCTFLHRFWNDFVVLVLFLIDYALGDSVALLCFEAA